VHAPMVHGDIGHSQVSPEISPVSHANEQGEGNTHLRLPVLATSDAVEIQNKSPILDEAREMPRGICISVDNTMYEILSCIVKRQSTLGHLGKSLQSHGNRKDMRESTESLNTNNRGIIR
jgi:hypothetical protein